MKLRVMSYNIHSGRDVNGVLDLDGIARVIREYKPDICALNEVRMRTGDIGSSEQARELGEALSMRWVFGKTIDYMGGEYGIGLLSRFPILSAEVHPVRDVPEERHSARFEPRALLCCTLDAEGAPLTALVSHFGLTQEERENAAALAIDRIGRSPNSTLFMGDLNMTPDDPLIARIRAAIPDAAEGYDFFTHKSNRLTDKIDYTFASRDFTVVTTFAPVRTESDHLPLITDVTWTRP